MKFIDEIVLTLESGKGGDGICSFRREKFVPLGGPDGGDGGKGGSIYFLAKKNILNLSNFKNKNKYIANNGLKGGTNKCTGPSGNDLYLDLPLNTKIFDIKTKELIFNISRYDEKYLIVKGGSNGYGNFRFKSSVNRSPKKITKGKKGEKRIIKLELNISSDICLIGLPNVGKSKMISKISNINTKISNYPFSTKSIYLGIYNKQKKTFLDTPSIIQKCSFNKGLGFKFLKHVLKTDHIFYILDLSYNSIKEIINNIHIIEYELFVFNKKLFFKNKYLIFNKMDKVNKSDLILFLNTLFKRINKKKYEKIYFISSENSKGLNGIMKLIENY